MRVTRLCAAVYLLILMTCAFQTTSDLWHLAFNDQLYGQTKERKWCVSGLLPEALRLAVEPTDHKLWHRLQPAADVLWCGCPSAGERWSPLPS